jgi:O-antigen/teichoic acid export membrane protein
LWLHVSEEHVGNARIAVIGAGLLCAIQLPSMLYRNAIVAAQGHIAMNVLLIAGVVLRFGGGAVVVSYHPTIVAFVSWHVGTLLIEALARSFVAWRLVGHRLPQRDWRFDEFRSVIASMPALAGAAVIGGLTTQADKLVLSMARPVEQLGHYFIASQLALGALQLVYPLVTTVLPRVIGIRESKQSLYAMNLRVLALIVVICVVTGVVYAAIGSSLLGWWLGEGPVPEVQPLLSILLIGIACNAVCTVGYMTWLAENRVGRILAANLVAFGVVTIGAAVLVGPMGLTGAAVAWVAANLAVMIWSLDWVRIRG